MGTLMTNNYTYPHSVTVELTDEELQAFHTPNYDGPEGMNTRLQVRDRFEQYLQDEADNEYGRTPTKHD